MFDKVVGNIPEPAGEAYPVNREEVNEETETPSESSTEQKPTDSGEAEPVNPPEGESLEVSQADTDKGMSGLAKTKQDLLSEVVALRAERRMLRSSEPPLMVVPTDTVDPETAKVLDTHLKAQGYVSKQEIYEKELRDAKDQWLAQHQEYLPKTADDLWEAINDSLSIYKKPTNPKQVQTLLDRAHTEVVRQFPDRFAGSVGNPASATKQNLRNAGLGSGRGAGSSHQPSYDSLAMSELRRGGFTEEEAQNIIKRTQENE